MGREKLQGSGAAPSSACSGGSRLEGKGTLQAEVAALPLTPSTASQLLPSPCRRSQDCGDTNHGGRVPYPQQPRV